MSLGLLNRNCVGAHHPECGSQAIRWPAARRHGSGLDRDCLTAPGGMWSRSRSTPAVRPYLRDRLGHLL